LTRVSTPLFRPTQGVDGGTSPAKRKSGGFFTARRRKSFLWKPPPVGVVAMKVVDRRARFQAEDPIMTKALPFDGPLMGEGLAGVMRPSSSAIVACMATIEIFWGPRCSNRASLFQNVRRRRNRFSCLDLRAVKHHPLPLPPPSRAPTYILWPNAPTAVPGRVLRVPACATMPGMMENCR
jgi:hypothetical protein